MGGVMLTVSASKMAKLISNNDIPGIPESFYVFVDLFERELKENGIKEARTLASKLVVLQSQYAGGRTVYIPSVKKLADIERRNSILTDYYHKGESAHSIAQKHHITESSVLSIVRKYPLPDED
ncbi:hypothetical protein D8P01_23270 [Salmonella enterica]|nr:hypothetical protein [Salmonella enterica]EAU9596930.1 hypothetical protein [Salmonella enterica]